MATPEKSAQEKAMEEKINKSPHLDKLLDMKFTARMILGGCTMEIADILNLGQGSVIELDTPATGYMQVWVNEHMIAKATSVVSNEKYGARIVQIASAQERLKHMANLD